MESQSKKSGDMTENKIEDETSIYIRWIEEVERKILQNQLNNVEILTKIQAILGKEHMFYEKLSGKLEEKTG